MSVQEQSLIGRLEITPIRTLLADDSDVIRRVLFDFLQDEPLIEIVGEAKDFTELLEKALALKPRIVLMDLHMRDEYKFKPELVRSELQASAGHVLAMSLFYDDEAVELSNSYGASLLLDKSKLITDLVRTVEKLCA
jgi:two-component system, NarL family, response regulator LiaR